MVEQLPSELVEELHVVVTRLAKAGARLERIVQWLRQQELAHARDCSQSGRHLNMGGGGGGGGVAG